MSNDEITLYDLATKPPQKCFSPNCWKSRAALNFKGIPYKTEWLEYPDVKVFCESAGVTPHPPDNWLKFTCPTIRLPDGTYVMDSAKIAEKLEEIQPTPSLRLDGPHDRLHGAIATLFGALMPAFLYKVRDGLNPRSAEYYEETRKALFGMGLDDFAKTERAQNAWENAKPGIQEVSAILHEHPEGPYVLGTEPSYADLVLASGMHCLNLLDPVELEEINAKDPAFAAHQKACSQWFARESY